VKVVRVLAEFGANVETPSNDGTTPAFIAAQNGHVKVVRALAELGANVEMPNNKGSTPAYAAAQNGHTKTLRMLASLNADVTAPCNGRTPLAISCLNADFDTTKVLLLLGAPVTAQDLKHRSESKGDTRELRSGLIRFANESLRTHRIFIATFLFGVSVHPLEITTKETIIKIPLAQSVGGLPIVSESAPMRLIDSSGRRVITTTRTTVTSTAITTTTTQTTTTNFLLPMLSGVQGILEKVAEYAAVVVGEELRHTRTLSPALHAVPWHLHDSR